MSTSLGLKRLAKRYGPVEALKGFDLEVTPGEFVTLLGPSGSGKTTVLKLIAGFEEPSGGDVLIGGVSVVGLPPYRRGIGMVFQDYALFPHLTVAENVAFPLSVRDCPRKEIGRRVCEALGLVKLKEYGHRYAEQLSGGQKQRVALARAVVFDPAVLLMDEPLGALDRNLREEMKVEIKRVQRTLDMTVVYVTHDQDEALAMSDRIAVMRAGAPVQIATGQELYGRPVNAFVARFLGQSNLLRCRPAGPGRARLTDGRVVPAPFDGSGTGHEHWLLVRPEQIVIELPAAAGDGALVGRVEEAVFLGEVTRYAVALGSERLTVKHQNRGDAPFCPGQEAALVWRPEDGVLLDD